MYSNDQLVTTLAAHLDEVAAEHELYQQTELGGAVDLDWSHWYCRRLEESGRLGELGVQLSADELQSRLERGFERFSADPGRCLAEHLAMEILQLHGTDS